MPPLREAELREVVSRPAQLLAARFETEGLIDIITRRTAEDSVKDVGALPLLSYTLDDMWTQMVQRGDGTLRLPAQSFELGGVLVDRANTFLATHPGAEAALRRVLTLRLATVREDGEPTRRRAARAEFSDEEWRLVCELADYPNRLLVTVTTETGETYAEVAHEAIFRRWDKLREWIAAEREFLAWRSGLEAARRAWQATPDASKHDALLMGVALTQAQSWLAKRAEDLPRPDREFIALSIAREKKAQARARRLRALVYVLLICDDRRPPRLDQSIVYRGAGEIRLDRAALRGREYLALRAEAGGRAGAQGRSEQKFQGMRAQAAGQGLLPRHGGDPGWIVHDGIGRRRRRAIRTKSRRTQ